MIEVYVIYPTPPSVAMGTRLTRKYSRIPTAQIPILTCHIPWRTSPSKSEISSSSSTGTKLPTAVKLTPIVHSKPSFFPKPQTGREQLETDVPRGCTTSPGHRDDVAAPTLIGDTTITDDGIGITGEDIDRLSGLGVEKHHDTENVREDNHEPNEGNVSATSES